MGTSELESLVRAAQAGDRAAFGRVVTQFADMAYGYAYSLLGDFHLAQDAAQEAFIEAFCCLGRLKSPPAFSGWFRRIVHYRCTRMTRGTRLPLVRLDEAIGVPALQPDPGRAAEDREMKDRVLQAIAGLPRHERTVTALFYINGYTQAEIAGFLEVPEGTVKSRLNASRRRLRERIMTMVRQTFDKHKLPDGFAGRVTAGVPDLRWEESGNTTYIAAVSAALAPTERATDYDSLMVYSGLAFRLRYVRRKDGQGWDTVGPVGQFEEEAEAVSWATGCQQPWVKSRDPEEMRRRIVAAVDAGYCPTAYIKGDNGVIFGYDDEGAMLLVRCYKLGEGFHRLSLEQLLREPGGGYGPFFLEPTMRPLSSMAATVHGLLMGRRNWHRGREPGEKWQSWRPKGVWEYCFGDAAYRAWLTDLAGAESLSPEQNQAFFRCHSFTVAALYDARLAAARHLERGADMLGDKASPHLRKAAEAYGEIGAAVRQLRHSVDAFLEAAGPDISDDAPPWTPQARAAEIATLTRAHELDRGAVGELERALAEAV